MRGEPVLGATEGGCLVVTETLTSGMHGCTFVQLTPLNSIPSLGACPLDLRHKVKSHGMIQPNVKMHFIAEYMKTIDHFSNALLISLMV